MTVVFGKIRLKILIWLFLLENLSWLGNFSFQSNVPVSFCLFIVVTETIQDCHRNRLGS